MAPTIVYQEAHRRYPNEVGLACLYGVAFFGHGRPSNVTHKRTTESIWRGLLRECLDEYIRGIIR